jgi:hypothetical protein
MNLRPSYFIGKRKAISFNVIDGETESSVPFVKTLTHAAVLFTFLESTHSFIALFCLTTNTA